MQASMYSYSQNWMYIRDEIRLSQEKSSKDFQNPNYDDINIQSDLNWIWFSIIEYHEI